MTDHLKDIRAGKVTKTNIIGIRKALNADARRAMGLSVSSVAPKLRGRDLAAVERALALHKPRVTGALHDSGLKLLRSPRYRKRLAGVRDVIDSLESFHLVGYDRIGDHGLNSVPLYMARGNGRSFVFRNVPWQSHGNGPEIIRENG